MSDWFRIRSSFVVGLAALAVLFAGGLYWLGQIQAEKKRILAELKLHADELDRLLSQSKAALTSLNAARFKTAFETIRQKYADVVVLLDTANPAKADLSPLEFKEELLKTQELLAERARLWNIQLPKSIGFEEFDGGNIPAADQIAKLVVQMESIRVLVNHLIESRVGIIHAVVRKDMKDVVLFGNQPMYQVLTFEISMSGDYENLRVFLHKLYSSSHLFIIRDLDIETQPDGRLLANLVVDAVKLKKAV